MAMNNVLSSLGAGLLLGSLVRAEVLQTLWRQAPDENINAAFHPGEAIGTLLSALWKEGEHEFLASIVADYMAEMRDHAFNRPDVGQRLTLSSFLFSLPTAVKSLEEAEVEKMIKFLYAEVPYHYSDQPDSIDIP
mgnify:CR=1 FL=1